MGTESGTRRPRQVPGSPWIASTDSASSWRLTWEVWLQAAPQTRVSRRLHDLDVVIC